MERRKGFPFAVTCTRRTRTTQVTRRPGREVSRSIPPPTPSPQPQPRDLSLTAVPWSAPEKFQTLSPSLPSLPPSSNQSSTLPPPAHRLSPAPRGRPTATVPWQVGPPCSRSQGASSSRVHDRLRRHLASGLEKTGLRPYSRTLSSG